MFCFVGGGLTVSHLKCLSLMSLVIGCCAHNCAVCVIHIFSYFLVHNVVP